MGESRGESEIKYRLQGEEDFRKLVDPGGLDGHLGRERQENHYFDTSELYLASRSAMLRIRSASREDFRGGVASAGESVLTLKIGAEVEAGYFRSTEIEAALPAGVQEKIRQDPPGLYRLDLEPVTELRARFGMQPLTLVGTLLNERDRFRSGGFLIEVDRMTFPGGSHEYEVEVETEDPPSARSWLLGEFRRLGIRPEPGRRTKLERLIRKIRNPAG